MGEKREEKEASSRNSLFVRAEIPSVAAKKRRPAWNEPRLSTGIFSPFLSRLTDSLCNSRNGGLLDPPSPLLFSRRLGIQLFQSRGNSRRWGPKRRGREKKTFFPFLRYHFLPPSIPFSYTCMLTCVRSLILCVFVRRPRGFKLAQKTAVRGKAGYTRSNDQRK